MSRKHKPKLGQNFLSDLSARERIVSALGDLSTATVIEIGPGHGALTELLATRARRLLAIELDRALTAELRFRFRNQGNVEILEANILTVDLTALLNSATPAPLIAPPNETGVHGERSASLEWETDKNPYSSLADERHDVHLSPTPNAFTPTEAMSRAGTDLPLTTHVIGNLPYYITSDILLHLFRASLATSGLLTSAVLMMQREVAERVASPPGRRDFGLLSATAQMHAEPEILFTLGPESFSPPPEVDSTVIRLRFHSRFTELAVHPASFDRFLHQAFAQKRKTLAKNLRSAGFTAHQLTQAWPPTLDPQIRAEATSLDDLAALHRSLKASSGSDVLHADH